MAGVSAHFNSMAGPIQGAESGHLILVFEEISRRLRKTVPLTDRGCVAGQPLHIRFKVSEQRWGF